MKKPIILEMFKDNVKVAEIDIADINLLEIEILLLIQVMLGRTWALKEDKDENKQ